MRNKNMDNRTIEEVRKNETKLINEIKALEQQCKKQKEVIDKVKDLLSDEFLEVIDRDILLQILEEEK